MIYKITYCNIEEGAHIFVSPVPIYTELVDCDSLEKLDKYITSQKDFCGNKFKINKDRRGVNREYDYISNQGGVKLNQYVNPTLRIKKI